MLPCECRSNSLIEGSLNKYPDLPPLAKWKAMLLEYGVTFDNQHLFNDYPGIELFKTKKRVLNPVSHNLVVTDESRGQSVIPSEVTIHEDGNTSIVKLGFREKSPIGIGISAEGTIIFLDRTTHQQIPLEAKLVKRLGYLDVHMPPEIDADEHLLSDVVDIVGLDRLSVIPFDGCWNWNSGHPCKFCDYNPKDENYDTTKALTNTLKGFDFDIEKWWDSTKDRYFASLKYGFDYLLKNEDIGPHKHLLIMSGNLPDPVKVWGIAQSVTDNLNEVKSVSEFDNYLNICPHPNLAILEKAKGSGIQQVQYNLEVIGEELFKEMCPGKMDYQLFRTKLIEAVKIMGFGKVRSNFVLGLQEPDELLEGISELADQGVVADYSIFQPKRATPLAKYPAPPMDTIVYFTQQLVKIYKEHGFNGIYCSVSSRSSIINECL